MIKLVWKIDIFTQKWTFSTRLLALCTPGTTSPCHVPKCDYHTEVTYTRAPKHEPYFEYGCCRPKEVFSLGLTPQQQAGHMEETRVPEGNHQSTASKWQNLYVHKAHAQSQYQSQATPV